jgi:hypothetical protein
MTDHKEIEMKFLQLLRVSTPNKMLQNYHLNFLEWTCYDVTKVIESLQISNHISVMITWEQHFPKIKVVEGITTTGLLLLKSLENESKKSKEQ